MGCQEYRGSRFESSDVINDQLLLDIMELWIVLVSLNHTSDFFYLDCFEEWINVRITQATDLIFLKHLEAIWFNSKHIIYKWCITGTPLPRVRPRGQCRQVTHDDVPTRRTMVGDAWGGQYAEVHGCGRFVPYDNLTKDPLTRMWSWDHCGVNDGSPTKHARGGTHNWLESATCQSDGAPA